MRLPDETVEQDGPNLTPVIDVVFLLLIFFLVATRYDQEERELPVNLPEVAQAQPLTMTQTLTINVTREGTYRVVQQEYDESQLAELIAQARQKNPHQSAVIRGDGDSALKHAARVMGLCNRAGMDYQLAVLQEQ